VLIDYPGQPGASNRPRETALAHSHHGTMDTTNRPTAAAAAAAIAANASAHPPPAGSGITASAATARSSTVNTARTASSRPANRRSQPRTVSVGRPNTKAIRRCPAPPALAESAQPITTAASARRSSNPTGSSTWVTPQSTHRARRGRSRTEPCTPRTDRSRPCPQPASTPEHPGHASRPPTSRRSTAAASPPTVTTTPPRVIARPSRGTPARDNGRAVAYPDVLTVPPETNKDNHKVVALRPSSTSTPPAYPLVLTLSAVEQGAAAARLASLRLDRPRTNTSFWVYLGVEIGLGITAVASAKHAGR
jgi:hypothetical protein